MLSRVSARTVASLALLACCAMAEDAAAAIEIRFVVDVTDVDDADGLVHALGWPVVAGDRLDGSILVEEGGTRAPRARLRLTCGRMDFEHAALRFSLQGGDHGTPIVLHWLGGITRRVHGGRAIRILVSLHPSPVPGDGHTLRLELHSLEESEAQLHDSIGGTVRDIEVRTIGSGPPWLPIGIGLAAIVGAGVVFVVLRRRGRVLGEE